MIIFFTIWFLVGYVSHLILFCIIDKDLDFGSVTISGFFCIFGPLSLVIYIINRNKEKIMSLIRRITNGSNNKVQTTR